MKCECKLTVSIVDEMVNMETKETTGITFKEMCMNCLEIKDLTEEEFKEKEIERMFIRESFK